MFQDPPPPPPPEQQSAWVREIEQDSPTPVAEVVVIAPDRASRYEPNRIEQMHLDMLERRYGTARCQIRIEPYDGPNPLWRSLFGNPLYRECGYVLTIPEQDERDTTPYDQ